MPKPSRAPWTPEDFFELQWVDECALSPDGARVAFTVRVVNRAENRYESSIWIADVEGGEPRRLTRGAGRGDRQPAWSPDGRRLYFASSRAGAPQIYAIELEGGEAWAVTKLAQGAHSPAVSPDGKRIAFLSRVSDEERSEACLPPAALQSAARKRRRAEREEEERKALDPRVIDRLIYRSGQEWLDGRRDQVFVQDAGGRRPPVALTSGDHDHSAPRWHPDGRWVYTTANWTETPGPEEVQDLLRVPSGGGKAEFLTPPKNLVSTHAASPDGRLLAYAIVPATKYYRHPVPARVRDLATGRDRAVSSALDTEAGPVLWGKDGREILFLAPLRGDVHVYAAPADGRSAPRPVVVGKRHVVAFDVSPRTGTVAFTATSPDAPCDLYVRLPDGRERRVTSLCSGLVSSRATSMPEDVLFRGHGGLPIQGWWMPARGFRKGKPGKLAVELHGGPHIMWGNSFWHEFQVLASAGYSVFFCNPRGSLGYGLKFKGMLYRNWGVNDSKDVLAGTDLMVKRKVADPRKLYLLGGSYGGYLTGWIVGHDHRFRAAVAQRGVYDLMTIYAGSDAQCLADWEFDASPWRHPEILLKHSPIRYADKVRTPTMVKHSDCDFTATINTAEEYYNALKRNGVDTVFVRYPREGHELSRSGEPAHRVDRIRRILDWFARHS